MYFHSTRFAKETCEIVDFIEQYLQFNPTKYISAGGTLSHAYTGDFHGLEEEPEYVYGPVHISVESKVVGDDRKLSTRAYREMLSKGILKQRTG